MKNVSQSRLPLGAFVGFVFLMRALPAEAHLNSTGMGPIYDGAAHFLPPLGPPSSDLVFYITDLYWLWARP
jgi:hypothetical protein